MGLGETKEQCREENERRGIVGPAENNGFFSLDSSRDAEKIDKGLNLEVQDLTIHAPDGPDDDAPRPRLPPQARRANRSITAMESEGSE